MTDNKSQSTPSVPPNVSVGNANTAQIAAESPTAESTPVTPSNPQEVFAKRERQLRKMQQDLQEQKQALEAKQKQYETDYVPKSKLKEDPWSILQETGLDYDQLTESLLAQPTDPASRALMSKLKALEAKMYESERNAQQSQAQQAEQVKTQLLNEIKITTQGNEHFELIEQTGSHDAVVELIESRYNTTGELLTVQEAAEQIENYLLDEAYKIAQSKKVQAKFKPAEPATSNETSNAAPANMPNKKKGITISALGENKNTLSNNMVSAVPKRSLTAEERRARAIAVLKGETIS